MSTNHKTKANNKKNNNNESSLADLKGLSFLKLSTKFHRKIFICIFAFLIILVIIFQFFYPSNRGLLFSSVANKPCALMKHEEMVKTLYEAFDNSKIKVMVEGGREELYDLKSIGAELNVEQAVSRLTDYPLWQKIIPGSIFFKREKIKNADVFYTSSVLEKTLKEIVKKLSYAPSDAKLSIKNGAIIATKEMSGSKVEYNDLFHVISSTNMLMGDTTVIVVPSKISDATLKTEDISNAKDKAEVILSHTVTILAADEKFTPSKEEIASWITIKTSNKSVDLSINKDEVKKYIAKINNKVGKPAGQTNINIENGQEVSRSAGTNGLQVDSEHLIGQINNLLLKSEPKDIELTAKFITLYPSVIYNSRYTTTEEGLQAFVSDIARDRNMRISIQQLDGKKWHVGARANESIPSASTFKLYVALVLFDRINSGKIKWTDPILDTNVSGCFERMTVASTNPCAESWIASFGREYINNFVYARGFSNGTSFTTGGAVQTTAADLTKFMIGLHNGTLVSGANRAKLLDSLGRHPYRYGIPTGSAGVVHDKVGFLWDYVHDTAIVQHPKGTYVMTIMTKGQSYAAIATATREIERIMYP